MGVNLVQKQVVAGTPVRQKELVLHVRELTWDTSETERTGGPGVHSSLLIPTEPIVLHKTIRCVQKESNKRQAIVGIQ